VLQSITDALAAVPHGGLLLATVLAVCAAQLFLVLWSWRGRQRPALHVPIAVSILLIPVVGGVSVHAARVRMAGAFGAGGGDEKAWALSDGISGQLNAIPLTASGMLLATVACAVALGIAASRAEPTRRWSGRAALLVVAGLWATLLGIVQWSAFLIHRVAALAGVDADQKPAILLAALDFARDHLQVFATISEWTIGGLTVVALILATRAGAPVSRRMVTRQRLLAFGLLAAAVALVLAAGPYESENDLPWPPIARGDALLVVDPVTPDLEGPDPVERAPVVQVYTDGLGLDGARSSQADLSGKLMTLRNFGVLNTGRPFEGLAILVVDARAPIAQVAAALDALREAGYKAPLFAFTRPEIAARPTFGPLFRVRASGVRAHLFDPADDELDAMLGLAPAKDRQVIVRLADFRAFTPLAQRLLAVRRGGQTAALQLGK
jgi:hypothetical protein